MSSDNRTVVISGAGLVGCVAAIGLAGKGWNVQIYESRPDPRSPSQLQKLSRRSINLAISSRALMAIKSIDSDDGLLYHRLITDATIPMKGRMIHSLDGSLDSQIYSNNGEARLWLCSLEMSHSPISLPNVSISFDAKIRSVQFDERVLHYEQNGATAAHKDWDLVLGADGAHSVIRNQLMRVMRMDYAQEYIPHAYLELSIPAGPVDGLGRPTFLLDAHHLHIWPRQSFMLIALPNQDCSFTCTFFAPFEKFAQLADSKDRFVELFRREFPDALALMGEECAADDFTHNPQGSLVTIRCSPYHYSDRAVILGDAAHSMVPFYGQGMNAGFEDVRVLLAMMDSAGVRSDKSTPVQPLGVALERYSRERSRDLRSIVDLAMGNYVEMRSKVTNPLYKLRKGLDALLNTLLRPAAVASPEILRREPFPTAASSGWMSLYQLVTFRPDISYADAEEVSRRRDERVSLVGKGSIAGLVVAAGVLVAKVCREMRGSVYPLNTMNKTSERKRPAALQLNADGASGASEAMTGPPTGYITGTPAPHTAALNHTKHLDNLHAQALRYWERHEHADCALVIPVDEGCECECDAACEAQVEGKGEPHTLLYPQTPQTPPTRRTSEVTISAAAAASAGLSAAVFNYDVARAEAVEGSGNRTLFWPPLNKHKHNHGQQESDDYNTHDERTPRASVASNSSAYSTHTIRAFGSKSSVTSPRSSRKTSVVADGAALKPEQIQSQIENYSQNHTHTHSHSHPRLLVLHLHKDFLTSQSSLFKAIFDRLGEESEQADAEAEAGAYKHLNRSESEKSEKVETMKKTEQIASETRAMLKQGVAHSMHSKHKRTIPHIMPHTRAIYLPIPDAYSLLHLVQALYFGHGPFLEGHLESGAVKWEGAVQNAEYLGLDSWVKRVLGRWWNRRVNVGKRRASGASIPHTHTQTLPTRRSSGMYAHSYSHIKQTLHNFDLSKTSSGLVDSGGYGNQDKYRHPTSPKSEEILSKRLRNI
ncbi:hypothetical protein E3P81_02552 [Wallemia ichthyophaga]|nr:hypothetical protein E3P97_02623 [Wallemia ichthyophaga]TIB31409.1 hypothetical protein E3P85_02276 [Wallemia ichthyophaga]TIB45885.1 hypothetical protein E3P82_02571 [Wallemia ichthyophaga]TIB49394.1 hypothetical protein E3P81_02552 [Wallemia ichthyophaga]TIB52518.1 hypothetical protein E3P80_02553 [Wallemia ichthyophaga]